MFSKIKLYFGLFLFCGGFLFSDNAPNPPRLHPPKHLQKKELAPGYNAPGRVEVRGGWDFVISASFLLWQVLEEGLDLAYSSGNLTDSVINERVFKMDFDWKPGFKAEAGVNFDHDNWSLFATYIWLHTKNKASYTEPLSANVAPYFLRYVTQIYDKVSSKWYFNLDMIDLALSRKFHIGEKFLANPLAGLSIAYLDQKYRLNAQGYDSSTETTYIPYFKGYSKSWGLGPKFGINTDWNLTQNLKLVTNACGKILYTSYDLDHLTFNTFYNNAAKDVQLKTQRKALRPIAEIATGFTWNTYLADDFWHIAFSALYEFQVFWDHNLLKDEQHPDNLYLNGATFTFTLDF